MPDTYEPELTSCIDEFIFPMTIHPDVSGRPHVLLMHERIIEHINKHEGVRWVTMAEVCHSFSISISMQTLTRNIL